MNKLICLLITGYQKYVSFSIKQLFGINKMCRYSPTCSEYALKTFKTKSFPTAAKLSFKRVISCNPLT